MKKILTLVTLILIQLLVYSGCTVKNMYLTEEDKIKAHSRVEIEFRQNGWYWRNPGPYIARYRYRQDKRDRYRTERALRNQKEQQRRTFRGGSADRYRKKRSTTDVRPNEGPRVERNRTSVRKELTKRFDKNGDGKVSKEERTEARKALADRYKKRRSPNKKDEKRNARHK